MIDSTMLEKDLTQGSIFGRLIRLALPIAGTQVMQMLYNLTDMFWLGRLGSDALAASGTAGLFLWLSIGLMLIGKIGTDIGVSQSRGRADLNLAYRYARTGTYIAAALGLFYAGFLFFLRRPLIGLFNFREQNVAADVESYLGIMSLGVPFFFVSAAIGSSFSASGNSKTPFIISGAGIAANMILDPLFIFTFNLGVRGAAIASIIAQITSAFVMFAAVKYSKGRPFDKYRFFGGYEDKISIGYILKDLISGLSNQIFRWTIPIFLEATLFCLLTMITSKFEISFGAFAIAMSRVGSQIESLTWLVGAGFGSALTVFVGQNYGAGKNDRIVLGVRYATRFMLCWGLLVSAIMALGGGVIYDLFLPDPALRDMGITFMRILAICQIPVNLESVFGNAFKGKGRTIPPSVCNISSNIVRVPLAYILSKTPLGLMGIWTAITLSSCMRGIWVTIWYAAAERKNKTHEETHDFLPRTTRTMFLD